VAARPTKSDRHPFFLDQILFLNMN